MINVCTMKLRKGKVVKTYNFESVSDAAIFENSFMNHDDVDMVNTDLKSRTLVETKKLIQELGRDPKKYGESEYIKIFHPEKVKKRKKSVEG